MLMKNLNRFRVILGIVGIIILISIITVSAVILSAPADNNTITYKVSFDLDGGSCEPSIGDQNVEKDSKATKPTAIPVKQGFDFNGWDWDFDAPIIKNTVIVAKWTPVDEDEPVVTYTVNFILDESDPTSVFDTKTVNEGEKVPVPETNPTKADAMFNGWDWDFNTPITSDTVIVAKWRKILTVKFVPDINDIDNVFETQIILENEKVERPDEVPTMAGYIFGGWDWDFDTLLTSDTNIFAIWYDEDLNVQIYLRNFEGAELRDNFVLPLGIRFVKDDIYPKFIIPIEYFDYNTFVLPTMANIFKDSSVLEGFYATSGHHGYPITELTYASSIDIYAQWETCFEVEQAGFWNMQYYHTIGVIEEYKDYVKSVTLPAHANEIEDSGKLGPVVWVGYDDNDNLNFSNMPYLETVNSTSIIELIGYYAFSNCPSLKYINLSNVTEICEGAFSGCTSLKTINLSSVEEMEVGALYGCTSLEEIVMYKEGWTFYGWGDGTNHYSPGTAPYDITDPDYIYKIVNNVTDAVLIPLWY